MIRFALKGMLARKLRTALTALAIVLGVTMVSGTFVLTDSIDKAFDSIFSSVYQGTDATITASPRSTSRTAPARRHRRSMNRCRPKSRRCRRVAAAIGGVAAETQLIGKNGKAIVFGGAPNLGFSVDPDQPDFNTLTLEEGAWPGRGRGRRRRLHRVEEGSRGRRDDRRASRGPGRAVQDLRARQVRIRRHDRRRHARRLQPADGSEAVPQGRQARSDSGCRQARRLAGAARLRDQRNFAHGHAGAHRCPTGGRGRQGHD